MRPCSWSAARICTRGFLCFRLLQEVFSGGLLCAVLPSCCGGCLCESCRGGGWGGGGADNVHLCRVHRAGSMKWLALLLYVVLVLRLSNVADLRLKRASSCPRKVVSGILNKLKIHEFPRRNHDFACFPLSSAASTLLVREPGLNPPKKHYIQHVSNP